MVSGKLISAMPPLRPIEIWDAKTGEKLSLTILEQDLENICSFVQSETKRVFDQDVDAVVRDASGCKGSANSYGRQKGYKSDYKNLPSNVLVKSRINMLFLHKLISETASYANSPNPNKKHPTFSKTINLGAIDSHMATLSKDGKTLSLLWKCWSREYLLEFNIPDFILKRDVIKYTMPTVRYTKQGYDFIFTIQEAIPIQPKSKSIAGLDLGRVDPYVVAVVNPKGKRVAHYSSSPQLKKLNQKREDILLNKKYILAKEAQYTKLGMDTEILKIEKSRLSHKAKLLGKVIAQTVGAEIAKKLQKHSLNTLHVENLSWATGAKYGSRWNHSKQQEAIAHAVLRNGTRIKKVNPKHSSRNCHECGTVLSNNGRKVRCSNCQTNLDRDYNAALNIATLNHLTKNYPVLTNRLNGDNCSSTEQVINHKDCDSVCKREPNCSYLQVLR